MFPKGIAIFTNTRQGVETAIKISDVINENRIKCQIYALEMYSKKDMVPVKTTKDAIKQVFSNVDGIVAVMATGIVVRAVAPLLKSKLIDPAVICVDTSGKFAISLLSGHYGEANKLAKLVADGLGATTVITTASEVLGKQSIDELAKKVHCSILNPKSLVAVNSALINEKNLALILSGDIKIATNQIKDYEVKKTNNIEQAIKIVKGFDAGVIVSTEIVPKNNLQNVVFLKPKIVSIGIGSRKVVNEKDIFKLVSWALNQLEIPLDRVDKLTTVDIKKDSESMFNTAKKMGLTLQFISLEDLRRFSHEDLSDDSKLVMEKIGVGGVCERAALMVAGRKAKLLLKKTKGKGVTVAIAEGE